MHVITSMITQMFFSCKLVTKNRRMYQRRNNIIVIHIHTVSKYLIWSVQKQDNFYQKVGNGNIQ